MFLANHCLGAGHTKKRIEEVGGNDRRPIEKTQIVYCGLKLQSARNFRCAIICYPNTYCAVTYCPKAS